MLSVLTDVIRSLSPVTLRVLTFGFAPAIRAPIQPRTNPSFGPPLHPQTSRENTYAELRRVLDENVRSRMKGDEKFQSFVHEELANLKNAVSLERQTRERDDGEIVDALVSGLVLPLNFSLIFSPPSGSS